MRIYFVCIQNDVQLGGFHLIIVLMW